MSEQILNQILSEINTVNQRLERIESEQKSFKQDMNQRLDVMDQRFEGVDQHFDSIESEHKSFRDEMREFREEMRTDLQVLKAGQQGIRTEITDRFKEVKTELNNHEYSIQILNRRQLKLEADVEQLKNR